MTVGEIHMALVRAQLAQKLACDTAQCLMWTTITPSDNSGKSFCISLQFERGPAKDLVVTLDAAISTDAATLDRLDQAITDAAPTRWRH